MRELGDVVNEVQMRAVCVVEPGGANQHGARKQVERTTTVTTPKSGWFDDDDVAWEGPTLLRENAKFKYAWLPELRLEEFLAGLREKYERSYYLASVKAEDDCRSQQLPGKAVNTRSRWKRVEHWNCECGPHSDRVCADEMIERSRRVRARGGKTLTGSGKKVGCQSNFVVRYPNVALIHAALPGRDTIDGFVRVAWSSEKHSAECADVKSTRVSRGALRTISQLTRQNPKHTDREIVEKYKQITNRVLDAGRDVNDCLTNQDEIRATNIMLKRSSDVGSGVATGFASRGNRSTIDSGKRNSLSRERSFAEQKKRRTR